MAQPKRRVSYVITPPTEPVPRLQLPPCGTPRLGAISPLLAPVVGQNDLPETSVSHPPRHPRHRLGVASLALDTSTQLVGKSCPEGILYTGGRDGLIISWDLKIATKRREHNHEKAASRKWEVLTGWVDDMIEEEGEDEDRILSDGDILGEVNHRRQRTLRRPAEIPYEQQWETDIAAFKPRTHSRFRQCAEAHFDWVNDIALCNYNQTVVSASSDGTIKAWNPHSSTNSDPIQIGSHNDYVRCLTYCREQNWVASGSFDRTVKLWDLNTSSAKQAIVTLNPPDATAPKSSVYALACDPYGQTIASGSPERVVRLWDPRSGKRTGKLVGHTDNIRAILISEDAKYLLTGSADASVKLWSLSSQRCLHTFTHHTDSVWSLFSTHPSLEIFYSGDRSGLVCRVDVEDCSDVSEGECIVLCQDSTEHGRSTPEGVNKIVVMDDNLLWTASGTSSVRRWHIPQRRATRPPPPILTDLDGERIPFSESPTLKRRLNSGEHLFDAAARSGSRSHSPRASFAPSVTSLSSDHIAPQQNAEAGGDTLCGIPMDSLVRLVSANDPFTSFSSSRGRDPEVATLYSAASIMSVPRATTHPARSPVQPLFQHTQQHQQQLPQPQQHQLHYQSSNPAIHPLQSSRTEDTFTIPHTSNARANYEERELATDAIPLVSEADDIIPGDHGLVRSMILNDRVHVLTVDTSGEVAVWDIVRGVCKGRFVREDVYAASQGGSITGSVNGNHGGGRSAGNGERERSPREALEVVRERIEGEAVIQSWCSTDTKAGVLAVHISEKCFEAEVYADEVGFAGDKHLGEEAKLNIGKWVLRNLFIGFIREEQRTRRTNSSEGEGLLAPSFGRIAASGAAASGRTSSESARHHNRRASSSPESTRKSTRRASGSQLVVNSSKMLPVIPLNINAPTTRSSPLITPLIPLNLKDGQPGLQAIQQSPGNDDGSDALAALPSFQRTKSMDEGATPVATVGGSTSSSGQGDYFLPRARQASLSGQGNPDEASVVAAAIAAVSTSAPSSVGIFGSGNKHDSQGPLTPGGLIGRLKSFGRTAAKRPASEGVMNSPILGGVTPTAIETTASEPAPQTLEIAKSPVQALLSGPLSPPPSTEVPLHYMPPNTTLIISEEASPSYAVIYRGTTETTHLDVQTLEEAMSMWLIEYLLLNKVPASVPLAKISFVLLPWNRDPDTEPLPELLNTQQSKLTASRQLRVRKIALHVQDKMDKIVSGSGAVSLRSSVDESGNGNTNDSHSRDNSNPVKTRNNSPGAQSRHKPEPEYEILCNDTLLPLNMTLAAVRQYVWKQGSELAMHYRKKAIFSIGGEGRLSR